MIERQRWLRTLATTPEDDLAGYVAALAPLPDYEVVRGPETGLAMVRGRIGGDGAAFNAGEMTMTKCTIALEGVHGYGYIAGRSHRLAELVALCDALLQLPAWHARVARSVLSPADAAAAIRRTTRAAERAATTADFVTVVRSGES